MATPDLLYLPHDPIEHSNWQIYFPKEARKGCVYRKEPISCCSRVVALIFAIIGTLLIFLFVGLFFLKKTHNQWQKVFKTAATSEEVIPSFMSDERGSPLEEVKRRLSFNLDSETD